MSLVIPLAICLSLLSLLFLSLLLKLEALSIHLIFKASLLNPEALSIRLISKASLLNLEALSIRLISKSSLLNPKASSIRLVSKTSLLNPELLLIRLISKASLLNPEVLSICVLNLFLQAVILVETVMPKFWTILIFLSITRVNVVFMEPALFLLSTNAELYMIVLTKDF